jgi:hypothetical protein
MEYDTDITTDKEEQITAETRERNNTFSVCVSWDSVCLSLTRQRKKHTESCDETFQSLSFSPFSSTLLFLYVVVSSLFSQDFSHDDFRFVFMICLNSPFHYFASDGSTRNTPIPFRNLKIEVHIQDSDTEILISLQNLHLDHHEVSKRIWLLQKFSGLKSKVKGKRMLSGCRT